MKSMVLNFFTVLFVLASTSVFAQQNSEILGTIIDKESGEPLRRATIMVLGTKFGGYSDVKGEFKVKNVPAGNYKLKISFVGYEPREIEKVEVASGKPTNIGRIVLGLEKKITEEIFVDARRVNDNESAILSARKNSAQVSDGISQQEMSRLPDSDAGQSLKRVSGVTLVDNKFVYVRGVSERYSNTTLNGASLSSTETDKKAFAFDMFPSEFLQNVNIAKSFTPDLPGNFAGGLVQLNTVDFPESKALKVSYSNSFNTNTTMKGNQFYQTAGGSTDWLGIDDGTRQLSGSVPSSRPELDALISAAKNDNDQTGAREKYNNMIKSFNPNTVKQMPTTLGSMANSGIGINYSNLFNLFENEFGFLASVNYGTSGVINNIERNLLMSDGSLKQSFNGTKSLFSTSLGGMVNMAYKLGTGSSISFRNVYNKSSDDESTNLSGAKYYNNREIKKFGNQYVEKELYSVQLGGEHSLEFKNLLINWNLGYSTSNRYEPDFRKFLYQRDLLDAKDDPSIPFTADISQTQQGDGASFGRFFSNMNDNTFSGKLDFTIPLNESIKIKFGTLSEMKNRDFSARSFTIIMPSGIDPKIEELTVGTENLQNLLATENFRFNNGLRIGEESKPSDLYSADESLIAGYLLTDIPFEFLSQNFRFIGGVRYEVSQQNINTFDIYYAGYSITHDYKDVLPSINLLWKVTDKSNIRTSATQTLSRPNLREISPFAFYDFENSMLIQGNPNLQRTLIQNYDLRYEYFPNPGEVISFSGFYKKFENAIEETIGSIAGDDSKTFQNSDGDALNYGLEVEFRKSLNFISDMMSNFALNLNFSYVNSEITVYQGDVKDTRTMWGQSPYSVNMSIFYLNPETQTSVNLAYNTYGKRIIQVGQLDNYNFDNPHVYELPRDIIDLSIAQPLFDNKLELKLSIRDLLNQKLIWEQGGHTFSSNYRGTSIGLSLGYKLN